MSDATEFVASSGSMEEKGECKDCSMDAIYRHLGPHDLSHVDKIQRSEHHTVLYELPYVPDAGVPAKPYVFSEPVSNETSIVRLPTAVKCMIVHDSGTRVVTRWNLICRALAKPITNSNELEEAIKEYNPNYRIRYTFLGLHMMFSAITDFERESFFNVTLKRIVELALRLPELIRAPIPLLEQHKNHAVSMSQQQAACLLANAFLCTFPAHKPSQGSYPMANFASLYTKTTKSVVEKLKCICHYFRRVCCVSMPTGVLTYERRYIPKHALIDWSTNESTFDRDRAPLHVSRDGTIEDQGTGLLQMIFANRFIGGGVFGHGCVQEEIRCVICPELLVGRLLFESLRETEAYFVFGVEQFSAYKNYSDSFEFLKPYKDQTPRDACGRRRCYIVGLDALNLMEYMTNQFTEQSILRELNKAYVGFRHPLTGSAPGIATGNWGCGAYGGSAQLKALLQLMVACVTERPLVYFTCDKRTLQQELCNMYAFLTRRRVTVSTVYQLLLQYCKENGPEKFPDVYSFLYQQMGGRDEGEVRDSSALVKYILNNF